MRIGIDLGGTKIEAILLHNSGAIYDRRRINTPQGDYKGTVSALVQLVQTLEKENQLSKTPVGIGTPGAISPVTGRLKNSNSVCLINQPLREDLEHALQRPIRMANDADCFALSEAKDGAAQGAATVFGVILGTGVGGGLVINGQLISGPCAIAGEWGHNPLPWIKEEEYPGDRCYCGKRGCIETFLSGPSLARHFKSQFNQKVDSRTLVKRALEGDKNAETSLQRYEDQLARALASVINIIDPHVIVLGGGLSNIGRLYKNVPPLLERYIFSGERFVKLLKAKYGDSSGVRGAAWLWKKRERD
ncbi:ROK family protein [Magnetococcales bacterium HHB-1]